MADVSPATLNHLDSILVQLLEVVARVRNLPRLKPKPANALKNGREVTTLFGLGVSIVIPMLISIVQARFPNHSPKIAPASVVLCVAEINHDSLDVANVQEPVRFRGETGLNDATGRSEVLLPELGLDLRVLPWTVEFRQEALAEDVGWD